MKRTAVAPERRVEIKTVGKSGQISLGKKYAGKMLRLDRRDDGTMLLTAVALVPESQIWTTVEPSRSRIARGLAWASRTAPRETDVESLASGRGADLPRRAGERRTRSKPV